MPRISALTSLTSVDNADEIAIVDVSASVTKKITRSAFLSSAPLPSGVTLPAASVTNANLATTTGEPGGAWQSYTPTWTAASVNPTVGNAVISGYYKVVGKTVFFRVRIVLGTTTTGGTGVYAIGLPIAAASTMFTSDPVGTVHVEDTGVASVVGVATIGLTLSTLRLWVGSGLVASNSPYTFGNTDAIRVSGSYEIA